MIFSGERRRSIRFSRRWAIDMIFSWSWGDRYDFLGGGRSTRFSSGVGGGGEG